MKNILFGGMLVIGMMTTAMIPVKAQVSVSINIGVQPLWGPVGYDYVEYYYLPDLEMYYYVPSHRFVYINGGRWVFATSLPYWYRHYDLYTVHKIVINEPRPYRHFHFHKRKYAGYRGGPHKQVMIRNSNNPKYFVVKGHPHHGKAKAPARSKRSSPVMKNNQGKNKSVNGTKRTAPKQYQQKNTKMNRPQHRSDHHKMRSPGKSKQGGGKHGGGHKGGKR